VLTDSRPFVRISKIAGKFRITRALGARLTRVSSSTTAKYCHRYGLRVEDIGAGSVLLFFVSFAASSSLLFPLVGYLCLLIGLLIAYGVSAWFYNWIPRRLERQKLTISYETPLILQEIFLASAGSGSIFDLVKLVIMGRHRLVSKAFSKITSRVNNGDRPEDLIVKYANYQPCEALRGYLLDAVSLNLEWDEIRRVLQDKKGDAEFEYQKYTMQAETRVLLIVGFGTFWPIIFSIAVFVNNLWRNLFSLMSVALLFTVLLYELQRKLMEPIRSVEILGGQSSSCPTRGLLNHTTKEELQETIILISLLGGVLLRENISPERAVKRASETYRGWLSPLLKELAQAIFHNGETFGDAWRRFVSRFSNPQCHQILATLPNMIEKTPSVAGERLMEVASYVKQNQTMIEERENVIGAQRFKAKLLTIFSSAALGMIGALSPLFMIASMHEFSLTMFSSAIWTQDMIAAVIVLLAMNMTNTYNATKAVGIERPFLYVGTAASVFLVVFMLAIRLISGSL
jgi:hypothetical protein